MSGKEGAWGRGVEARGPGLVRRVPLSPRCRPAPLSPADRPRVSEPRVYLTPEPLHVRVVFGDSGGWGGDLRGPALQVRGGGRGGGRR